MCKLFYVIGASGVGKDTLINYARNKLNGSGKLIFAHRYITREPFAGSENHIYLKPEEFELRRSANLFSLSWESHGHHYGIGIEINKWMEMGFSVVVNGSRQYLPEAQLIYPELSVILIEASPLSIANRLTNRRRESNAAIESRIKRTTEIQTNLDNYSSIQNDGVIEDAGEELIRLISERKI